MTKTSIPRLRRVRFKNGHTIEVLRTPKPEDVAARLTNAVKLAIDEDGTGIVGYAMVVWRANGTVFPAYHNGDRSQILAGAVPQYAKDVLLAEVACRWARD